MKSVFYISQVTFWGTLAASLTVSLSLLACTGQPAKRVPASEVEETREEIRLGGIDAGGGNAVVCYDQAKNITSVELLDLYEARIIDKKKIKNSSMAYEKQIEQIVKDSFFWQPLLPISQVKSTIAKIDFIPKGTELVPIADSHHRIKQKGCKVVQMAIYSGSQLLVARELWAKLNPTNKAALIFHEVLYRNLRESFNDINSIRARKLVGHAFAGSELTANNEMAANGTLFDDFPYRSKEVNSIVCSDSADFSQSADAIVIYQDPKKADQFIAHFYKLNGLVPVVMTRAKFETSIFKIGGKKMLTNEELINFNSNFYFQTKQVDLKIESSIDSGRVVSLVFNWERPIRGRKGHFEIEMLDPSAQLKKRTIKSCTSWPKW